jgi:acetyl esterase/lipase
MKHLKQFSALIVLSMFFITCKKEEALQEDLLNPKYKTSLYDIRYGDHYRNYFDIALPKNRTTNTPVVILIHGGAWVMGNKNYFAKDIQTFADAGIACVTMNYRYASDINAVHHPDLPLDIRKAIDFICSKADKWQVSTTRFGLAGHSAGAQLAMITSYLFNEDGKIKACASWAGPNNLIDDDQLKITGSEEVFKIYTGCALSSSEDTLKYKNASPYWMVNASSVPTLLVHGTEDPGVPYSNAVRMKEKLDQLGVPNSLVTMEGAYHIWTGEHLEEARRVTLDWFKARL